MKKAIIFLCIIVAIICTVLYPKEMKENEIEAINKTINQNVIPYVPLKDREKTIIYEYDGNDISSLKGEKIFIAFWSSYCKYCLEEYDAIRKAQEEFKDMTFVIISHDKSLEELEEFLDKNPGNFFIIYNPSKSIRTALNPDDKYIPSSYILDSNHNIIRQENTVFSADELINFIKK